MKRPFCRIDGVSYQLEIVNGVVRFPDDNTPKCDYNKLHLDYGNNKISLKDVLQQYVTHGSSYELVYGYFSRGGGNNHIVNDDDKPFIFQYYPLTLQIQRDNKIKNVIS